MSSFALQVEEFARKAEINAIQAMRLTTLYMFVSIIRRTPVDTGRAKGSWTTSVYTLPAAYSDVEDKSGNKALTAAALSAEAWDGVGSIFIVSNLDYIEYLEDGSSDQAPNGMVAMTVAEFNEAINAAIRDVKRTGTARRLVTGGGG